MDTFWPIAWPGIPLSNIALRAPLFPCGEAIFPWISLPEGDFQVTFLSINASAFALVCMLGTIRTMWLLDFVCLPSLKLDIRASIVGIFDRILFLSFSFCLFLCCGICNFFSVVTKERFIYFCLVARISGLRHIMKTNFRNLIAGATLGAVSLFSSGCSDDETSNLVRVAEIHSVHRTELNGDALPDLVVNHGEGGLTEYIGISHRTSSSGTKTYQFELAWSDLPFKLGALHMVVMESPKTFDMPIWETGYTGEREMKMNLDEFGAKDHIARGVELPSITFQQFAEDPADEYVTFVLGKDGRYIPENQVYNSMARFAGSYNKVLKAQGELGRSRSGLEGIVGPFSIGSFKTFTPETKEWQVEHSLIIED